MNDKKRMATADTGFNHADLLPQAWRAMILSFGILIAAAWIGFGNTNYAALMLVISAFYCVMYFGLPWIMFRMRTKLLATLKIKPIEHPEKNGFGTFTGWTGNRDAFIQILTIPAALAIAMVAIAIVNVLARPS